MNFPKTSAFILIGSLSATLSACGGGSEGEDSAAEDSGASKLIVAVQPYAQLAPTYMAQEKGYFEDNKLDVELLNSTGGGSSVVAGLISGDIDIAYTSWASFLQAASKDLPLQAVRANDQGTEDGGGLFVMPDSGIETLSDLADNPVGVNLGGTQEITTRALLADAGVSEAATNLVNTPQSNMVAAISSGKLKAGWLAEPFMTLAEEGGAIQLSSAFQGPSADIPVGVWIARKDFIADNGDQVDSFVKSIDAGMEMAIADREAVNATILTYTEIDPSVVEKMRSIDYVAEPFNYEGLDRLQDLMTTIGLIPTALPLEELASMP